MHQHTLTAVSPRSFCCPPPPPPPSPSTLYQSTQAHTYIGSFRYMAPERIVGGAYDDRSDVWSLGLCVLEALLGRYPFVGDDEGEAPGDGDTGGSGGGGAPASQIALVLALTETPPPIPPPGERCSEACAAFLHASLARDPAARATAQQLLQCPWFAQQRVDGLPAARARVAAWLAAAGLARAHEASG